MENNICAVRDCEVQLDDLKTVALRDSTIRKWKSKLAPFEDIPAELKAYYDASSADSRLSVTLLSMTRIIKERTGTKVNMCTSFSKSLSTQSKTHPKPEIDRFPESVQSAYTAERRLNRMASMAVPMTVCRAGKHRVLRGHVYVFIRDPTAVSLRIPRNDLQSFTFLDQQQ